MRAIWRGHIRFSLVTIPIRLYGAIETSKSVKFRQLHREDNGPIGYTKTCKVCSEKVSTNDIVKAYEYEPDQYVVIEKDDLESLQLKSTKVIEIEAFVDASDVHPSLFDTPYFAGPDGDVAAKAYGLLCQTLNNTGKLAIGRVVLREKESIVLISPQKHGLQLFKLRYPAELRNIDNVPQLAEVETDDSQLKLAETLVESMTKDFSELVLEDRYKQSVMEMINAKIAGKEVVSIAEEEQPIVDIMTALKKSIDQAKTEMKPMKKATGKKTETKASSKKKKTG